MKASGTNTDQTSSKAYRNLIAAGDDWADKKAAATVLEKQEKNLLAKLACQSNEKSEAAKKRFAEASDEYQQYVETMTEARRLADKAKVLYDSIQAGIEIKKDENATKRAEMKL